MLHKIKTSALLAVGLFTLLSVFFAPSPVSANHDQCTDPATQAGCKGGKQLTANGLCFDNFAGDNAAITTCVNQVNEHFNFSGDPDGAPALPAGAVSDNDGDDGVHKCGGGSDAVDFTFDIGCRGEGNPILDILFAVIRFLTYTVGIVLVGAMIITGIQHTLSRENPEATKHTVERLLWIGVALLIYVFAFAILNFLVPGGLLQ